MKKLLFSAVVGLSLTACNQPATPPQEKEKASTVQSPPAKNITIPYTPTYSTDFELGDYKYAKIVLDYWKKYDDNQPLGTELFADTVSGHYGDGSSLRGKEIMVNSLIEFRNTIASVKDSILTYVVLKAKDKDETWVCIWSKEINNYKNGKTDTIMRSENWRFNKDGKVSYIGDYTAK